jgi:hypothetical protein
MNLKHTIIAVALSSSALLGSAGAASKDNPGIVTNSGSGATAYSSLAAAWWQWATETPAPEAAVIDETGVNCANNQKQPGVFFLAGTLGGGTLTRTCTVPAGSSLFFPLANDFYGAFLTDPASTRTTGFVRKQTQCVVGAAVTAEIDGVPVGTPTQYLEQSTIFSLHLPEDNVFGVTSDEVPDLTLDPSADRGYYLYVKPLAPGAHTIHFTSAPGTSTCTADQDITYNLTVR